MKRLDMGPAGKVGLVLMAALVMALAAVGPVAAEPQAPLIPAFPHFFYGTVTTDQGILLPGKTVTAQAANPGGWTGATTETTDALSRYGYGSPQFQIPGIVDDSGSGASAGEKIEFLVEGVRAALYDVAAGTTSAAYPFTNGGDTELNLTVSLKYTINATAGPNGSILPPGTTTINYGFNQLYIFTPNTNYVIEDVLVDGVSNPDAVAAGSYTFTYVTAPHTIRVTFVKAYYLITPTAGVGCTIMPDTVQTVPYKGSQTFNITANTGYDLVTVLVDGASQGPIPSYTFPDVRADHKIEATCKLKQFVITPYAGAHGSIDPPGPQTVSYDGSVTFTMVPDPGYAVDDVTVNGVSLGPLPSYTFRDVVADGWIRVTFKVATFVITATAGPNGSISPQGAVTVIYSFNQTFTFTPNTDYVVQDVLVDGVSNPGAVATGMYVFTTVTADHTIHVTFAKATYTITPTAGVGCTITPGTPQTVPYKGSKTFTIAAKTDYALIDVKVDGVSDPGAVTAGSYTFSNVDADHAIAATCMQIRYRVSLPIILR